jgi:uncharacterized membrane protein (DUF4010 family)
VDTRDILVRLGVSLGLGLLVGLQRERKGDELAGIRTFSLLTVLGTLLAFVGMDLSTPWVLPAGAVALGIIMAVGFYIKTRRNQHELGLTTEIAALVMYGLGAYLAKGDLLVALVLGGAVVLLLYWKQVLHGFVQHMGDQDVSAVMQFVLIALVIWPVLPREKMGPFNFFNPFETWLVVVLVVGMSLGGYVLYKLVPPTAGALLGGAVGGLVSSTAATVSYARRARSDPESVPLAAQAIMMANTVSVVRVMALLGLFLREDSLALVMPLGVMAGVMGLLTAATCWRGRHAHAAMPAQGNPTELKAALLFAAIYTVVKLGTAWGKATFGAVALYVVGGISGLTDVDAITLSISDSVRTFGAQAAHAATGAATEVAGDLGVAPGLAWRVILVAILANLVFKGGTVMVLGNGRLKKWIAALFLCALAGGVAIIFVWRG